MEDPKNGTKIETGRRERNEVLWQHEGFYWEEVKVDLGHKGQKQGWVKGGKGGDGDTDDGYKRAG